MLNDGSLEWIGDGSEGSSMSTDRELSAVYLVLRLTHELGKAEEATCSWQLCSRQLPSP